MRGRMFARESEICRRVRDISQSEQNAASRVAVFFEPTGAQIMRLLIQVIKPTDELT